MKIKTVIPVMGINIDRTIPILPEVILTKDFKYISEFTTNRRLKEAIGGIHMNHISSLPCVIYIGEIQIFGKKIPQDNPHLLLDLLTETVMRLFTCAWLLKDNNFFIKESFFYAENGSSGMSTQMEMFTKSSGYASKEQYTQKDFEESLQFMEGVLGHSIQSNEDFKGYTDNVGNSILSYVPSHQGVLYNSLNRMNRAFHFLKLSRASVILPLKITNYCAVIECLFSTGKDEIRHQVSLRCGLFVAENKTEAQELYTKLKFAYDIRSSFIHGNSLPKKAKTTEELQTQSLFLDNIVRRVFTKILKDKMSEFSDTDDKLNRYLLDLTFSNSFT